MSKVTIMQEGMKNRAYIDGKDVSGCTMAIDVRIRPDETPVAVFDMLLTKGFIELCESDVEIKIHPDTVREAITLLRIVLLEKGDLYKGFLASIASSFKENGIYEPDIEHMAEYVLNRIIGMEGKYGSD